MEMEELETGFIKQTFTLTTPHGKALTAPVLECGKSLFFGRHSQLGTGCLLSVHRPWKSDLPGSLRFRNADGSLFNRTPNFARTYRDYSDTWTEGKSWRATCA